MADALDFLSAAYADKPAEAQLSVVIKPDFGKPRLNTSLEEIATAIEGTVDLWIQASAVTGKPASGRSDEELVCWAPGLWIDIDVNGSPRNAAGKLVEGAAPDREQAVARLRELIKPSVVWTSGWGIQAFLLTPGGVLLRDEEDRRLLEQLNVGFRTALCGHTGWKLDSVQDVVRLLRPPGSVNGKRADEPKRARLIAHTDAAYGLDELAGLFPVPTTNGTSQRRARRLKPPLASSPDRTVLDRWLQKPRFRVAFERPVTDQSDRDFEIARVAMEDGAGDDEAARVVQAARAAQPDDDKPEKAVRPDYLQRTIEAARQKGREEASADLNELRGLLGVDHVAGVDLFGRGSNSVAYIQLGGTKKVVLDTVGRCASTTKLTAELAIQAGAEPKLKAADVNRILVLFHRLAQHHEEHEREDQAADHGFTFLRAADVVDVQMSDQASRWWAFSLLDQIDPVAQARLDAASVAAASTVLKDSETGNRYVRISWLKAYVRQQAGPGEAEQIARAMLRVGWTKPGREGQVKATAPDRPATLHWAFFVVPDGWEN